MQPKRLTSPYPKFRSSLCNRQNVLTRSNHEICELQIEFSYKICRFTQIFASIDSAMTGTALHYFF